MFTKYYVVKIVLNSDKYPLLVQNKLIENFSGNKNQKKLLNMVFFNRTKNNFKNGIFWPYIFETLVIFKAIDLTEKLIKQKL